MVECRPAGHMRLAAIVLFALVTWSHEARAAQPFLAHQGSVLSPQLVDVPHVEAGPAVVGTSPGTSPAPASTVSFVLLSAVLAVMVTWTTVTYWKEGVPALTLIIIYFLCVASIKVVMKAFFESTQFKFPLFVTACHLTISGLVSLSMHVASWRYQGKTEPVFGTMSWTTLLRVLPTALIIAVSIGVNNWALTLLNASVVVIISMWTPLVTFMMDVMRGEHYSWTSWAWIVVFCASCTLCCAGFAKGAMVAISTVGVALSVTAVLLRGVKTTMQSLLMSDGGASAAIPPLLLMGTTGPVGGLVLLAWSLAHEGTAPFAALSSANVGFLLATCAVALGQNIASLYSIRILGPATSQAAGSVATLLSIWSSAALLHEAVSLPMWIGSVMALVTANMFNRSRGTTKDSCDARKLEESIAMPEK